MESIGRLTSAVSSGAASAASRSASPFGAGGLAAGQTIHARVTRVQGDTVQLRWGDQSIAVASRVPLTVGQQIDLQVEEGANGTMLLRMVDSTLGNGRQPSSAGTFEPTGSAPSQLANGPVAPPGPDGPNGPEGGPIVRGAMPTYGKLAQSVSGAAAFGQLMAKLGHDAGRTLARAPLAPADLGRLLVTVGVHPDEVNAVLVGEMLAQGVAVNEASIRTLRRGITAAGGTLRDAAAAIALSRLGLPITPLSLAIARQLQAGQLDPPAAWGELLTELHVLARDAGAGSQAGALAAELLADWRVPVEDGAEGIARWLQTTVDRTATPLEAKLARAAAPPGTPGAPGSESGLPSTPSQDVRARLDLLSQTLPTWGPGGQGGRGSLGEQGLLAQALQRTQATVQAEQILNGAPADRTDQRYFAVTLPTVMGEQSSTLELRVREREAGPRVPGEIAQPDVVQMKLSLPSLGDLGVNLMVGQHSVSCHFSAASPFAEALLTASSSELVGRLKRLGFSHMAVDAAHEPPERTAAPLLAPAPTRRS
jgi:hypothetical protein